MNVEKRILSRSGDWVFDREVAEAFDDHVRKSIPCYDVIQDLIASLSIDLLPNKAHVYDLGTATGEVIRRIHRANPTKKLRYVGLDVSRPMVEAATRKCQHVPGASFRCADVASSRYAACDLVVATFTLQFLPLPKRKATLNKIRDALKLGASFLLGEKIVFDDADLNELIIRGHERWKETYFSRAEIDAKRTSLQNVMRPLTVAQNTEMLSETGFTRIQPIFQWGNFVCLLAR